MSHILTTWYRQWKIRRQLAWQQILSRKGIGFRTKLVDISEGKLSANGYKDFCIRALLRVKGKIVFREMHTLLKVEQVQHRGDRVLIRYMPSDLNRIFPGCRVCQTEF